MRKRRPTSWLLGFAGSAVVHVSASGALFAFGRATWAAASARRDVGGRDHDRRRSIPRSPARSAGGARFPSTSTPPARAWDAHEGDRDELVPLTARPAIRTAPAAGPAPDQGEAAATRPITRSGATIRRCGRA
jgi:hypothetical protein